MKLSRAESIRVMHPLFQAEQGGSTPTSALQLFIEPIAFKDAKALNRVWHSRLPRLGTGFVENQPFPCFAATFEGIIYAVAIWSNPEARNLPQRAWLELRRFAIAPDRPRNTATRMLRIMELLLRRKRPWLERFISYQDIEAHAGTIYAAAGWKKTIVNPDGNWDRPNRSRPKAQIATAKQRWEKELLGDSP